MGAFARWASETATPIAIYLGTGLLITVVFSAFSGGQARVGTFRSIYTVLPKFVELVLAGVLLGLLASLGRKRVDLSLITLSTAFVALLDIDHLPSVFGIAQPIRPAHSITYIAITVVALTFVIRNRPEVELIAISSFLGHLATDTGVFAPFAPFSFEYLPTDEFRVPLAVTSVLFAFLAGYYKSAKSSLIIKPIQ